MDDTFVLWSVRGAGWFTKASATHSDLAQAQRFTRPEALKMVALHRNRYAPYGLLPVSLTLLEESDDKR